MLRVALIYNPASGQHLNGYVPAIDAALAVLRAAGVEAHMLPTRGPGTAHALAEEAVRSGCDTIIACGGDGTVHEVLQSLVGTETALGVVPMGTANALAADLGIGGPPARAVKALLTAAPVRIPVGKVAFFSEDGKPCTRYFVVAAGVGADGEFFYRLNTQLKRRFGYAFYFAHAMRMWFTHSFPLFQATFESSRSKRLRSENVSQLLAVRISNFGGLVHNLVPGAALKNSRLRMVAFKTRNRFRYLKFMMAVWFRRHTFSSQIELLEAPWVECSAGDRAAARIYVEADGELLGSLPARIEILPDALTLLMPAPPPP